MGAGAAQAVGRDCSDIGQCLLQQPSLGRFFGTADARDREPDHRRLGWREHAQRRPNS